MASSDLPCLKRWTDNNQSDERLGYFSQTYEEWYSVLAPEVRPLIDTMLDRFEYYGHKRVNQLMVELNQRMSKIIGFEPDKALYTYIKDFDGRINSSTSYWADYRLLNKIKNNNCTDDITRIDSEGWNYIDEIVIIDDCCGTGSSLKKFLADSRLDFNGKVIYYAVIHAMENARNTIKQLEIDYHVKIQLLYINIQKNFFEIDDTTSKLLFAEKMKALGITRDSLGFEDSEALMAFYNNTPNNTFPVFWQETAILNPIFPREKKGRPLWEQLRRSSKQRKLQNYQAQVRYNGNK